jgi:hypothetical protein
MDGRIRCWSGFGRYLRTNGQYSDSSALLEKRDKKDLFLTLKPPQSLIFKHLIPTKNLPTHGDVNTIG